MGSSAEQYGVMTSDRQTHTHINKPPSAGVQLVGHTMIISGTVGCRTKLSTMPLFLNAIVHVDILVTRTTHIQYGMR